MSQPPAATRKIAQCAALALCLGWLLAATGAAAQAPAVRGAEIELYQQSVASLRALFAANSNNPTALESLLEDANRLNAELQDCDREESKSVLRLEGELDSLGDPPPDEAPVVKAQRQNLRDEQAAAKSRLATCKVLADETSALSGEIADRSRAIVRQRLFVPGTSLMRVIAANLADASPWLNYLLALGAQYRGLLALGVGSLFGLAATMLLAMIPGWLARGRLQQWGASRTDNDFTSILLQSLKIAMASYLPWLLASLAGSIFFLLVPAKPDDFRFWGLVTYSLTAFLGFMLAVRVLLYPLNQLPSPTLLPPDLARAMARRLRVLGLLGLLGVIYYASLQVLQVPPATRQLARGIFLTLIVCNLIWLVWLLGRLPKAEKTSRRVRMLLALTLTLALCAEWLGYRGLSAYLLIGIVGTVSLSAATWILHVILAEIAGGLERGKYKWQRRTREAMGLTEDQHFPGLNTLRVLFTVTLWTGLALLLLKLWGVPDSFFQRLYLGFENGFDVVGLHITPQRIVIGLLIFVAIVQVVSRLKEGLEKRWLPASRLDRGAREATATVFGYVGFLVAVIIGLAATGLDLTKLAIIAGALSVGIGFGLQNIVNNFVSGLILLFERPIVPGDYVSVGETEGYVRRISIRSTQIETIDRRSVVVPNSDLISNRVINWMRNDNYGRIRLDIGVSYGSNLKQVAELLKTIAEAHPDIINDSHARPSVICTGITDRGINFAILAAVRNFMQRPEVISDLYLEIEAAFSRQGIEIPFAPHVLGAAEAKSPAV